jgi:uncharacterized membrane protein YoaK (UPF0700 family)
MLATALTLTAGFVDAIGYSHLGKLYLSFMSGNTTGLGSAVASGDVVTARAACMIILMFVLGAGLGALVADAADGRRLPATCASEAALFGIAFLLSVEGWGSVALMPLAIAMGMQNTLRQHVLDTDLGKGFVTGSLVSAGECFARAFRRPGAMRDGLLYVFSWLSFVGGVILGAIVLNTFGIDQALLVGALVLSCLVVATFRGETAIPTPSGDD